jgi:hypothetical protein
MTHPRQDVSMVFHLVSKAPGILEALGILEKLGKLEILESLAKRRAMDALSMTRPDGC